jgi:hypothetical protein
MLLVDTVDIVIVHGLLPDPKLSATEPTGLSGSTFIQLEATTVDPNATVSFHLILMFAVVSLGLAKYQTSASASSSLFPCAPNVNN